MSCTKTKPKKMSVRPAKTQISLGIRPVWSESSLCTQWVAKDPSFPHADSEDSDQTGWMPRLTWVSAGHTLILLVLSCLSSIMKHRRTCECFETQCLMIFKTLIVAAVLITDSRFFNNLVSVAPEQWNKCAASSEFVSSSIPSWRILTAHAQPFSGARDLAFYLKVPHDSLLVWASSDGSGETVRMRRLAWTFAARIGDKYQIRLTRPKSCHDKT